MRRTPRYWAGTILLLGSLPFVPAPVSAQVRGGFGFFAVGPQRPDLHNLNRTLNATDLPSLGNVFFSLGGGGGWLLDRFLLGGGGHGLLPRRTTRSDRETRLRGGYGFFDIGYVFAARPRWRAYGLIGLGGGSWSLDVLQSGRIPDFSGLLERPAGAVRLETGGFLLQEAVGWHGWVRPRGLFWGLQVGYVWQPAGEAWRLAGASVVGGPDVRLTGPYVRFLIGGQGVRPRPPTGARP
jgi:hypothetical protein